MGTALSDSLEKSATDLVNTARSLDRQVSQLQAANRDLDHRMRDALDEVSALRKQLSQKTAMVEELQALQSKAATREAIR